MSSGNIQIGFPEDNRSHQEMRTPAKKYGHVSTMKDILSETTAEPDAPTPRKNASASSIQNILHEETDNKVETNGNKSEEKNGDVKSGPENGAPQYEKPKHIRMPPGGYSAGFW